MRRVLAAACLALVGLSGWGRPADDYLLPQEDQLLRDAEGFQLRSYYRLRVMARRIDALECRHRSGEESHCRKLRDRDPLISELEKRTDLELLTDYYRALRSMLLIVEEVFAGNRGRTVEKVLTDLRDQADTDIETLAALEKDFREPPELRAAWEDADSLARKAAAGARKGLDRLSR
jgi:hypothetical protein